MHQHVIFQMTFNYECWFTNLTFIRPLTYMHTFMTYQFTFVRSCVFTRITFVNFLTCVNACFSMWLLVSNDDSHKSHLWGFTAVCFSCCSLRCEWCFTDITFFHTFHMCEFSKLKIIPCAIWLFFRAFMSLSCVH